ncbi:MAG: hypothetical protein ACRCTZ_09010 [Sarcina sp.]
MIYILITLVAFDSITALSFELLILMFILFPSSVDSVDDLEEILEVLVLLLIKTNIVKNTMQISITAVNTTPEK